MKEEMKILKMKEFSMDSSQPVKAYSRKFSSRSTKKLLFMHLEENFLSPHLEKHWL